MYVRCADCLSASWVEVVLTDGLAESASCAECGRDYVVTPAPNLGPKKSDHYRATLRLSHEHDIDMPSAYAVLIGFMSLQQAQFLRHASKPQQQAVDPPTESSTESGDGHIGDDLDPGYREAIAQGTLTVQEAVTRGDRSTYVTNLMSRHEIPEQLASRVADNRISLSEARRQVEQQRRSRRRTRPRSSGLRALSMLALSFLTLGTVAWSTWTRGNGQPVRTPVVAPTPPAAQSTVTPTEAVKRSEDLLAATEVRGDDQGRVLEIVGPDPRTVLLRYCDTSPASLEALEITSTVPPFREARLGLFRDYSAAGSVFAIRIRRDGRSGRWITGGSSTPIVPKTPPELPMDALRVSVEDGVTP